MQFQYSARDKNNKLVRGTIEAKDQTSASSTLRSKELTPVNIRSQSKHEFSIFNKVPLKDKIIFTEQLAVMIKSGLPIVEALKSLKEETESKYFARVINQITEDVEGGTPFSNALEKHPKVFNEIFTNLIKSGEKSGNVDIVLNRLTNQLQKEYELNRKIRGALSYPIFVLVALVGVMSLILITIIPQLKQIFDDAGVELPVSTKIVIALSLILKNYWPYVLTAIIGTVIALGRWRKTNAGKRFFDRLIIKIPVVGNLMRKSYMARFARTFSSLISSGLPLLEVFKVSGEVMGNILYKEEVDRMAAKIKNGQPISATIKQSALFPGIVGQLAAVGEHSGSLDDVFETLAGFFERDVDNITSNLSTLLEPVMMIVMGVGIGALIISVLQPIYGLVNAV